MSKNKLPEYSYKSLFEEWKDWDKNKRVIIGRTISYNTDGFSTSDYEIRNVMQSGWRAPTYDNVASDFNLPKPKFLPRFHKYGLKDDFHNCDYRFLLNLLEVSPKIETLFKTRQKELLFTAVHKQSEHNRFWSQIKIVLRHKYKIKDAGLWYDYLDLLSYFGKDLHSPKYICPANLKAEHDRYVKKKRIVEKRQKLEAQKKKMITDQKNYEKEKGMYFGLAFQENGITIKVIDSVEKVLEYGDKFKHCIYTNAYYKKKDSLLLVAYAEQEPVETIELSLSNFKVLQSRGLQNEASKFNQQILEIISKNTSKIKNVSGLKLKKVKKSVSQKML
ncbi:PcfJ domain-containing protein [Flavobacterium sp.]|uniref:PcfJ domain-containing protein n=1 Tax=Flavobacterium sp. TaxID=239 RepID=UPI0025C33253|nr:PcfJ domain-containing protein [Flavobacterium sp.]